MLRREVPTASSRAALAKITTPSLRTTATSVARRSNDWKRSASGSGLLAPLPGGRAACAPELALDAGDVFLIAVDARLEFGHAVQVLLVVAVLGPELLGFAVVEFLLQFGLEDGARFGVARLLLAGIHALRAGDRLRRGCHLLRRTGRRRTVDPR